MTAPTKSTTTDACEVLELTAHAAPKSCSVWPNMLALVLGVAMTLSVQGYRFGESNHAVYLIDPLRRNDPSLLVNDWWTRSTLQYHVVFNVAAAGLMRLRLIEPVFLAGYLALAALLHVCWLRWTRLLGGTPRTYVLSVVLYHLLAGGIGLGMYEFLQDGEFLPSNIAGIAMLWGLYAWARRRAVLAGVCLGIAALFHLNYAIVGAALWAGLSALAWREASGDTAVRRGGVSSRPGRGWLLGTLALGAGSLVSLLPALRAVLHASGGMALPEFVELYVRLRHPHHYDPSSWPAGLWVSFLLPFPPALWAFARLQRVQRGNAAVGRTIAILCLMCLLVLLALVGSGMWYVSETLVQMSLYRFSVYVKLLTCVGAAFMVQNWMQKWRGATRANWVRAGLAAAALIGVCAMGFAPSGILGPFLDVNRTSVSLLLFFSAIGLIFIDDDPDAGVRRWPPAVGAAGVLALLALSWPRLGFRLPGLQGDNSQYSAVCDWARTHTPVDAIFVVPPDEELFRLRAQRAIVVNFKGVPQLGSELAAWRDRLQDVLDLPDLRGLPHPFVRTLAAVHEQYESLPEAQRLRVARRYGARYLLVGHALERPAGSAPRLVYSNSQYYLYDLAP